MIYYFCLKKGRIPFGVKVLISDIKTGNAYALMKNHIYSTFDLSKSLEHFQEKVTKLLELTNISEWDGHVFREREKKIREIALVLAGECTALLLHNLSQSQDFLDKALLAIFLRYLIKMISRLITYANCK